MKKKRIYFIIQILLYSLFIFAEKGEGEVKSKKYILKNIDVKKFIEVLPDELKKLKPQAIEKTNSLIIKCSNVEHGQMEKYIVELDVEGGVYEIDLKYLSSEELMRYLPPSVGRENIIITSNPNLIFFKGSEVKYKKFLNELDLIDKAKPQIRYQLLVVQYEKSNSLNWARSLEVRKNQGSSMYEFSGSMSNIFNLNFDIVSKFGYQFIAKLNFELAENKARVLADTTLNGLTGEEVKFQNTNTFRYIDKTLDASGKPLYGSMREITSGLVLNIKGFVSGDEMITMDVNAQVSKQGSGGSASSVLPPTSEKIIRTKVRTQSGRPIIIGGLLQVEKNTSEKKVPWISDIPIIGIPFKDINASETVTEMVIYIVPYLHKEKIKKQTSKERIKEMYEKYVETEDIKLKTKER